MLIHFQIKGFYEQIKRKVNILFLISLLAFYMQIDLIILFVFLKLSVRNLFITYVFVDSLCRQLNYFNIFIFICLVTRMILSSVFPFVFYKLIDIFIEKCLTNKKFAILLTVML